MTGLGKYTLKLLLLSCIVCLAFGQLHRAKPVKSKSSTKNGGVYSNEREHSAFNYEEKYSSKHSSETWIYSILSATLVGLSGIFPLLIIPLEAGKALRHGEPAARLKLLLSFAVGGLLGDVFLHLLPEAWKHIDENDHTAHLRIGLWVLAGILSFLIIEKCFSEGEDADEEEDGDEEEKEKEAQDTIHSSIGDSKQTNVNGHISTANTRLRKKENNGSIPKSNGDSIANTSKKDLKNTEAEETSEHIRISGWLNLLANVIDNFTHGLAVAASYCISTKSGVITTFIILLHEIPHEVGDFAILLRAGFDRWKAAKAQLLTASGGVLGAITALAAESVQSAGDRTAWILPFTSGSFIYIALVTCVPDLLKEKNPLRSFQQVVLLCLGISLMAFVSYFFDEHDYVS